MARLARPLAVLTLALLPLTGASGQAPQPPLPPADPAGSLQEASRLFKLGTAQPARFADAAKYFAAAFRTVEMSPDQLDAWAYCRVRLAYDRLHKAPADAATATEVIAEVEEALRLAPAQDKLQALGATLIADAARRGGRAVVPAAVPALAPAVASAEAAVETANFRVLPGGNPAAAATVARAAEESRAAIWKRWTGHAPADWPAKCVVTLHPTGEAFALAAKVPAGQRGRAAVDLADGRVTARRLDLSLAGDLAALAADVLPRELTHAALAELFPAEPPPLWAALGMAVLATSDAEQDRYRATFARCADAGTLPTLAALTQRPTALVEQATEFHVGSAALVALLVRWRGETEFLSFLNLTRRYGSEKAANQVYGVESLARLEGVWTKSVASR